VIDVERIVEFRIVDQSFPADGGAWFFEIDPHDDEDIVLQPFGFDLELFRILDGGFGVMDRAGTDDGKQAVVIAAENRIGLRTGAGYQFGCLLGEGQVVGENRRGNEGIQAGDSEVVSAVIRHAADG
jgi:hypothetical protein